MGGLPDDWEKFKQVLSDPNLHPIGRIEIMQAHLDALENITPTMQIHVDAIRKIHVEFMETETRTLESLDALEKQNEHWLKIQLIRDTLPAARLGRKFTRGRVKNSVSKLRKSIQREIKTNPNLRPAEIWKALAEKPPKGLTFQDNRMGKYIEEDVKQDGVKNTGYKRFCNIVSEEKNSK